MATSSYLELESISYDDFERMREDTKQRAYSMALQLTRNTHDAQDLLQETYLKAWKGFGSYLPDRPFLNWLLRIMQRAYLDGRRRDNPIRKAESLYSVISPSDGEVQEIPIVDESASAEDELIREEFSRELEKALAELPQTYRDAIYFADVQEMSYSEIADMQGTTVGTVRSRIHRGRRMLRDIVLRKGIARPAVGR